MNCFIVSTENSNISKYIDNFFFLLLDFKYNPKIFDWKENYEYSIGKHREGVKNEIGFIAQDVEKIIPNLVTDGTLEARDFDMDLLGTEMPEYKGKKHQDFTKKFKFLNYEKLIPHLVSAMQEQQEQIEGLQKQIEELQKK